MQTPWLKITPVILTLSCALAINASITTNAYAGQNYGTPEGTLTVTTPDTNTEMWPGDPTPHYVIRADQGYTATSTQDMSGGKFDSHGEIGILRFFQTRTLATPASYTLAAMQGLTVISKDMPANSPFTQKKDPQTYGPYTPDSGTFLNGTSTKTDLYGVETIQLVFVDKQTGAQTILDTKSIDVYFPNVDANGNPLNSAQFSTQNFPNGPHAPLNTNTAKSYLGDPPRLTLTTSQTIYPKATLYVVIYPGASQTTPPNNAQTVATSSWTAPNDDNWIYPITILMDIGKYVTAPGIYTVQAMQNYNNNTPLGIQTFGQPSSFSVKANYNVSSQLGLVK